MYLTRMELHPQKALRILTSPQKLHGMVETAFSGGRKRRLWRVDALGDRLYVLILSEDKPELHDAAERYAPEGDWSWQTRDYAPLLERVKTGSVWQFRLTANPTKSKKMPDRRGQVKACGAAAEQEEWLQKRAEAHGFSLKTGEFRVTQDEWRIFSKKEKDDRRVTLRAVSFEGLLTVTDASKLSETLLHGIGRGKAYGMGLLTLARPMGL